MIKHVAALAVSLFIATNAQAATVFDQSFDPSAPVFGGPFSEGSNRVYDNFSLASGSNLSSLTFWGAHWTTGVEPSPLDFAISLYNNAAGVVGSLISNVSYSIVSNVDTGVDHNNSAGADIREYTMEFDSPLALAAGDYWLSVYHATDAPGTTFVWQRSSGSSGNYIQNRVSRTGDMAFRLDDGGLVDVSPVPLPAAGWLLLASLAGLGAASRRKVRSI